MKRVLLCAFLLVLAVVPLPAQIATLSIAAGTPEDKESQAISNEADAQKRAALWNEFVQKFASNPTAVAYGNLQLAQQLQTSGDLNGALAATDKAVAAVPNSFEVLMSGVAVAQQAKNWKKVAEYAAKAGELYNSIGKQKPADVSDADFATQSEQLRTQHKEEYDSFEAAAYNGIAQESSAKQRMASIEAFTAAFPKSRFSEPVAQLAIYSLSELKDMAGIAAYGEKALAANPESFGTLSMLATALSEQQGPALAKARGYAQRAIELAKAEQPGADTPRVTAAGLAYSALGFIALKEEKTQAAIPELKKATSLLKGGDPVAYQTALFRLGFAYAKLNQFGEARTALGEAAGIQGPYQAEARRTLEKVNAARPGAAATATRKK